MEYIRKLGNLVSDVFPYNIGECIQEKSLINNWSVHRGTEKSTGSHVLVYKYVKNTASSATSLKEVNAALQKCKTLRHPYSLKYLYSEEKNDVIYLVTEYAIPLTIFLDKIYNTENKSLINSSIVHGLYCLTDMMIFLHNSCKLHLNKLFLSSIFVTLDYDWKIFGYNLCGPNSISPLSFNDLVMKYHCCFSIPEKIQINNVDTWSLGSLIYILYNWTKFDVEDCYRIDSKILLAHKTIPENLVYSYIKLLTDNSYEFNGFMTEQSSRDGIFTNDYVQFNKSLATLHLLEKNEIDQFFEKYTKTLNDLPSNVGYFKLLPILQNINSLAKLSNNVQSIMAEVVVRYIADPMNYSYVDRNELISLLKHLFESIVRSTRIILLKNISAILDFINDKLLINTNILPYYVMGFTDNCFEMQCQTISAITFFIQHLHSKDIDTKILPLMTQILKENNDSRLHQVILLQLEKDHDKLSKTGISIMTDTLLAKLNIYLKAPTSITHDIFNTFLQIEKSLNQEKSVDEIIPVISKFLTSQNEKLRNDAADTLHKLIDIVVCKDNLNTSSNNIYYSEVASKEYRDDNISKYISDFKSFFSKTVSKIGPAATTPVDNSTANNFSIYDHSISSVSNLNVPHGDGFGSLSEFKVNPTNNHSSVEQSFDSHLDDISETKDHNYVMPSAKTNHNSAHKAKSINDRKSFDFEKSANARKSFDFEKSVNVEKSANARKSFDFEKSVNVRKFMNVNKSAAAEAVFTSDNVSLNTEYCEENTKVSQGSINENSVNSNLENKKSISKKWINRKSTSKKLEKNKSISENSESKTSTSESSKSKNWLSKKWMSKKSIRKNSESGDWEDW